MEAMKTKKQTSLNVKNLNKTPAPEGLVYVVIGPYCWGKGPTETQAFLNARKNGGKGIYTLHLLNAGCEIDQVTGAVYYNSKENSGIRVAYTTVRC